MMVLTIALFGILGAVLGSFLNVVIHRVPIGASIVRPRSQCVACGHEISAWDNVPVLSYIALRGRCRACLTPISIRYPLVEAATAVLFVGAWLRFEIAEQAAFAALAGAVLLGLSVIDLEHRRLPNSIVLPSLIVALVWVASVALVQRDSTVGLEAVASSAGAFAVLLLIALISRGMGLGDVKLAALIGLVTGRFGWEVAVTAIFGGFFIGGLIAVVLLVLGRRGRKDAIPFGPSLAAGAILALCVGDSAVRAWLGI